MEVGPLMGVKLPGIPVGIAMVRRPRMRFPRVLSMRERSEIIDGTLARRLESVLPIAMEAAKLDMWVLLCRRGDFDPLLATMMPMNCRHPALQVLACVKHRDGMERINLSAADTSGLYDSPMRPDGEDEQLSALVDVVESRDPDRIGVNIGATGPAAGGLSYDLHTRFSERLPEKYASRLVSAEPCVGRWLSTLTIEEIAVYDHVANVAHALLAECLSRETIIPNVTTTEDLEWHYLQRATDLGLDVAFRPYFVIVRSPRDSRAYGPGDMVARPGDLIHADAGLQYLRLHTDHQQNAYVLRANETSAPEGMQWLMGEANRLQDIFMSQCRVGLSGSKLISNTVSVAAAEDVPHPRVFSHPVGYHMQESGPLIGMPWERAPRPVGNDVRLTQNQGFAMELSVRAPIDEWDGASFPLALEEGLVLTENDCRLLDGRQTEFHLV
jgi:hypothetical protein